MHVYGNMYIAGLAYAVAFNTSSDQSSTDDIEDSDLTVIFDNCNIKSYNRSDNPELGKRLGFIFQDIQKACTGDNLLNTLNHDIKQEDDTTLLGFD